MAHAKGYGRKKLPALTSPRITHLDKYLSESNTGKKINLCFDRIESIEENSTELLNTVILVPYRILLPLSDCENAITTSPLEVKAGTTLREFLYNLYMFYWTDVTEDERKNILAGMYNDTPGLLAKYKLQKCPHCVLLRIGLLQRNTDYHRLDPVQGKSDLFILRLK